MRINRREFANWTQFLIFCRRASLSANFLERSVTQTQTSSLSLTEKSYSNIMVQPGWKAILVTTTAAVIAESLRQAGVVGEDAGAAWVYGTLRPLMDDILALMSQETYEYLMSLPGRTCRSVTTLWNKILSSLRQSDQVD